MHLPMYLPKAYQYINKCLPPTRQQMERPILYQMDGKSQSLIFQNAVAFPPLRGGKVLAALAERLAKQGIQGI